MPMTVITPYAATLTLAQARRLNAATSIGKYAWQNRKTIYRAARSIGKFAMARRKRRGAKRKLQFGASQRSGLGNAARTAESKRSSQAAGIFQFINFRTLYAIDMLSIPQTGIGDVIDQRERDVLRVKGVKTMVIAKTTNDIPVMMHYALVTWKNQGNVASNVNFFRQFDSERGLDFDTASGSSMVFNNYPINSDVMHIHYHKKQVIGNASDNATTEAIRNNAVRYHKRWTKFYRQVRYNDLDVANNTNLYFIYWYDRLVQVSGAIPAGGVQVCVEAVTYFNDPKP